MKPKGQIWRCILCNSPVDHLHEIFYGKNRQLSIKYNIQVPVCICAHPWRVHHSGNSEYYKQRFCGLMGIDKDKVLLALNTRDTEYLEKIAEHMGKKLDKLI